MNSGIIKLDHATKAYQGFSKIAEAGQSILLLLIRINWGWQFYESGIGKLMNHERTLNYFTNLGIPLPSLNAWLVGGVECVGGILLLVGLASRPAGLILSISMTVAYLTADKETVFNFFSNQDAFFQATPFLFLLSALLIYCFGPGRISLDSLLNKYFENRNLALSNSPDKEQE